MIQVTNDTFGNAGPNELRFDDENDLKTTIHSLAVESGWYNEYLQEALLQFEECEENHSPIEGEDYMSLEQFETQLFKNAMKDAEVT